MRFTSCKAGQPLEGMELQKKMHKKIKAYQKELKVKMEVEPVEPVQMNIYQSNTYRKDLSWLHFDDEARIQERQQVKDQQPFISVFVAYPTVPSSI